MTVLRVVGVYPNASTAKIAVRCETGRLRVGQVLTGVRQPGRDITQVELWVDIIETISGGASQLMAGEAGRLWVHGHGIAFVSAGCELVFDAKQSPAPAVEQAPEIPQQLPTEPLPSEPVAVPVHETVAAPAAASMSRMWLNCSAVIQREPRQSF